MQGNTAPQTSIALPVYNGERYLREALDSILGQTYDNFEIIITDNASTDATQAICTEYAHNDPRVRYYRNPQNIGVYPNFELGISLARGIYFKWMAHDDQHDPHYLEMCTNLLTADPTVALAHAQVAFIDEHGTPTGQFEKDLSAAADASPVTRFKAMTYTQHECTAIFGVTRTELLGKTNLVTTHYHGSDRALLAELSLLGKIVHLPQTRFYNRQYATRESLRIAPLERKAHSPVPNLLLLHQDYRAMINRHIQDERERKQLHALLWAWWLVDWNFIKPSYERLAWHLPRLYHLLQRLRGRTLA